MLDFNKFKLVIQVIQLKFKEIELNIRIVYGIDIKITAQALKLFKRKYKLNWNNLLFCLIGNRIVNLCNLTDK